MHAAVRTPSWFHNLVANPDVAFGGVRMRATVVCGAERDRLWVLADSVFPAFARYRRLAVERGRVIPLVGPVPVDARGAGAPEA